MRVPREQGRRGRVSHPSQSQALQVRLRTCCTGLAPTIRCENSLRGFGLVSMLSVTYDCIGCVLHSVHKRVYFLSAAWGYPGG